MSPLPPQAGRRLVVVALAVAACDGAPPRVKPWRHAPDPLVIAERSPRSAALGKRQDDRQVRERRGHTLRIHVDAAPRTLHPLTAPSVWSRRILVGPVFEPLLRYRPPPGGAGTGLGSYQPALARSWRIQLQATELIIELDPDARWHDGRPVTSVDVQFTLDTVRNPDRRIDHLRPYLASVETVELVNPRTVRVRLRQPDGWFLRGLAEIPIVPYQHYHDDLGGGGRLIGSGPFKIASTEDGLIRATRWDAYRGGPPAIADLEYVYQPDAAAALMAAQARRDRHRAVAGARALARAADRAGPGLDLPRPRAGAAAVPLRAFRRGGRADRRRAGPARAVLAHRSRGDRR
jgi:ABC-type transport system substrate-binding protein